MDLLSSSRFAVLSCAFCQSSCCCFDNLQSNVVFCAIKTYSVDSAGRYKIDGRIYASISDFEKGHEFKRTSYTPTEAIEDIKHKPGGQKLNTIKFTFK